MGYYVSHCESGSWALMQPHSTQHIIDAINGASLCGKTPQHGRWFGNPKLLTPHSFRITDCELCGKKAAELGIWMVPAKKERPPRNPFRIVASAEARTASAISIDRKAKSPTR